MRLLDEDIERNTGELSGLDESPYGEQQANYLNHVLDRKRLAHTALEAALGKRTMSLTNDSIPELPEEHSKETTSRKIELLVNAVLLKYDIDLIVNPSKVNSAENKEEDLFDVKISDDEPQAMLVN